MLNKNKKITFTRATSPESARRQKEAIKKYYINKKNSRNTSKLGKKLK